MCNKFSDDYLIKILYEFQIRFDLVGTLFVHHCQFQYMSEKLTKRSWSHLVLLEKLFSKISMGPGLQRKYWRWAGRYAPTNFWRFGHTIIQFKVSLLWFQISCDVKFKIPISFVLFLFQYWRTILFSKQLWSKAQSVYRFRTWTCW